MARFFHSLRVAPVFFSFLPKNTVFKFFPLTLAVRVPNGKPNHIWPSTSNDTPLRKLRTFWTWKLLELVGWFLSFSVWWYFQVQNVSFRGGNCIQPRIVLTSSRLPIRNIHFSIILPSLVQGIKKWPSLASSFVASFLPSKLGKKKTNISLKDSVTDDQGPQMKACLAKTPHFSGWIFEGKHHHEQRWLWKQDITSKTPHKKQGVDGQNLYWTHLLEGRISNTLNHH